MPLVELVSKIIFLLFFDSQNCRNPLFALFFFFQEISESNFIDLLCRCCRTEVRARHATDVLHFLSCFSRLVLKILCQKAYCLEINVLCKIFLLFYSVDMPD